ncbi:MAG: protein kinase [Methyloglobulus sp.]|nr:protein kinase [Methyloglobulus sp.]
MNYSINGNVVTIDRDAILIEISIDNIKFIDYLGEGANSIVFRGFDELLERDIAIKIWISKLSDTRDKYIQALREAKKIASLKHHNIVDVYHANSHHQSTISLEMELIKGTTLREYLKSNKISMRFLNKIWHQIFDAMSYSYQKGIYHGDLHDRNILIIGDSDIKILDFGTSLFSSRISNSENRDSKLLLKLFEKIFGKDHSLLIKNKSLLIGKPEMVLNATKSVLFAFERIALLKNYFDNNSEHLASSAALDISGCISECPFLDVSVIISIIREQMVSDHYVNVFLNGCINMLKLVKSHNPHDGVVGYFCDESSIDSLVEAVNILLIEVMCLHNKMYEKDKANYLSNTHNLLA